MNTATSTFSYRVSRLDGVARLDVRGLVTDDTAGPVEDACAALASGRVMVEAPALPPSTLSA